MKFNRGKTFEIKLNCCRLGGDGCLVQLIGFGFPSDAVEGSKCLVTTIAVNENLSLNINASKPQFHFDRHVTSRHDTTRTMCRVRPDERVEPCLFQHGGRRGSSSARVYKFSLLCSGFASISGTTSGKSEVVMSTPVHAVATPLNTCRASRACFACRDERVAPC